jgi:hypothetical protein
MDALGGEESKLTEDLEVKGGSARTRERRNESGLTANSLKKRGQTSVSELHLQVGTRPKTVVLIPKKTPKTFHFITFPFILSLGETGNFGDPSGKAHPLVNGPQTPNLHAEMQCTM